MQVDPVVFDPAAFDPAVFDREALERLRGEVGDEAATAAFVRSYLGLLSTRAGALRAAAAAGDAGRLWEVAASLGVTSEMVGAARLAGWCRGVQERAAGSAPGGCRVDLFVLEGLVTATATALRDAFEE